MSVAQNQVGKSPIVAFIFPSDPLPGPDVVRALVDPKHREREIMIMRVEGLQHAENLSETIEPMPWLIFLSESAPESLRSQLHEWAEILPRFDWPELSDQLQHLWYEIGQQGMDARVAYLRFLLRVRAAGLTIEDSQLDALRTALKVTEQGLRMLASINGVRDIFEALTTDPTRPIIEVSQDFRAENDRQWRARLISDGDLSAYSGMRLEAVSRATVVAQLFERLGDPNEVVVIRVS